MTAIQLEEAKVHLAYSCWWLARALYFLWVYLCHSSSRESWVGVRVVICMSSHYRQHGWIWDPTSLGSKPACQRHVPSAFPIPVSLPTSLDCRFHRVTRLFISAQAWHKAYGYWSVPLLISISVFLSYVPGLSCIHWQPWLACHLAGT